MKLSSYLVLSLTLALVTGCGKGNSPHSADAKTEAPAKTQLFEKMATNDVLVVVNGVRLDKKSLLREVAIQMEIYQRSHPNARVSEVAKFRKQMLSKSINLFIERQAVLGEAARRKITLTDGDRTRIRRSFADNVLKGKIPYEKFMSSLDSDMRKELEAGLDKDMICQKLDALVRSECPGTISDGELETKFKNISAYNVGAKADEDQIWRNASNDWKRIVSGESFEVVGKSCSETNEHVRYDMEWGDFELDFFKGDTQLCRYLVSMKNGAVTPPVTGDNGLLIVKMLESCPVDFTAKRLKPHYRLAMIFYELPEYYPLSTKEQLRKELSAIKIDREHKKRLKAIVDGAKVEYPQGKCVFPKK